MMSDVEEQQRDNVVDDVSTALGRFGGLGSRSSSAVTATGEVAAAVGGGMVPSVVREAHFQMAWIT